MGEQKEQINYKDVTGWNWQDITNEFNLNKHHFLRLHTLHPEMLQEGGQKRKLKDDKFKFSGENVIFDRNFVVEKFCKDFESLNCYESEQIDSIVNEVKEKLVERKQQHEQQIIDQINNLAKELGMDKQQLSQKLEV